MSTIFNAKMQRRRRILFKKNMYPSINTFSMQSCVFALSRFLCEWRLVKVSSSQPGIHSETGNTLKNSSNWLVAWGSDTHPGRSKQQILPSGFIRDRSQAR